MHCKSVVADRKNLSIYVCGFENRLLWVYLRVFQNTLPMLVMDIFWVGFNMWTYVPKKRTVLKKFQKKSKQKVSKKELKMGLISDRRNKAKQQQKNAESGSGQKMKKGLFGGSTSHMFPLSTPRGGSGAMVPKYPPGYYTTPVNHSSSWSHPGQPKFQPNVNPRYQTWIAPRKQPALGQLVIFSIILNFRWI